MKVFVRLKYKNSKIQIYQLKNNALEMNVRVWRQTSMCGLLTKVREDWFPESRRNILTIVLVKTIFPMWWRVLELVDFYPQCLFLRLLDPEETFRYDQFKRNYAEILYRWDMHVQRTEVMKFCTDRQDEENGIGKWRIFFVIHFFIVPIRWNLRVEHTIEFVLTPLPLSVIKSALYSFRHTLLLLSYCIDIVVFSRRILPTISTMVTNRGLFVKKRNSFDQPKLSFGSIRVQKNTFNISLSITGTNVLYVLLQNEVILNFHYRCSSWMYFM